jgi:hypothetical protein
MTHGLLWLPLLAVFVLLVSLGWIERRRQQLFRAWPAAPSWPSWMAAVPPGC